jgi:hypothetical protein
MGQTGGEKEKGDGRQNEIYQATHISSPILACVRCSLTELALGAQCLKNDRQVRRTSNSRSIHESYELSSGSEVYEV